MADSKKHHFVPQFVLNNFTDEENEIIHIFDKKNNRSFSSSVLNTGHENNFNSVEINGEKFNFEEIYSDLDGAAAPVIKMLVSSENRFDLNHGDLYNLSLFICVQLFRTKLMRTTIQQFSKDILAWANEGGQNLNIPLEVLSEEHSKAISLSVFDEVEEMMTLLLLKGIVLYRSPGNFPFWISDNPVVMYNEYPYGRRGLATPGTDVFMPISKNLMLGFLCRINCNKISEAYNKAQSLKEPINSELKLWHDAIQNNIIIDLKKENVDFYNSLQVVYSSRFLYGPTKDFSMAEEMIKETPSLKERITNLGINHERKFPGMPMGEVIVCYLENDHFMMPVELVLDNANIDLVFYPDNPVKLFDLFINKTEISCIEVYKDQMLIRLTREVSITGFDITCNKVTIQHTHEGLHKFLSETRSEERRVGKECRSRWSPYH